MEKEMIYDFDTVISRQGTHAEKYEALGEFFGKPDAEPFWVADMDLPTPAFLVDALRERIGHPMYGYTTQYDEVFDAIIWWMRDQHGAAVERDWITLSPCVVTTIALAIEAFTAPGDCVALLSPLYGPFFTSSRAHGREVADCPLRVENGRFEIDFPALEAELARPDTTLLMFCSPHNPGGRVWSRSELERLLQLCIANDVVFFNDEIHSDIVYPPARNVSLLTIPGAEKVAAVPHSIGKTFNCGGLLASFMMIPDPELRGRFQKAANRFHVADVNLLGKVALETVLSPAGAEYKRQLIAYLRENTRLVTERLLAAGIETMLPESTFLVWSDFRTFGPWREVFDRLLSDANVALSGGEFFGPAGEGWFRINCAHPRAQLLAAVDRIVAAFSS
jgi:cystathionine beta-lyase